MPAGMQLPTTPANMAGKRRLTAYMAAYMKRAKDIETRANMSLLTDAYERVSSQRRLLSNTKTFPVYYALFALAWALICIVNLF